MAKKKKPYNHKTKKNNSFYSKGKSNTRKGKKKTNNKGKQHKSGKSLFGVFCSLIKESFNFFKRLFKPTYYISHKLHLEYKSHYGVFNRRINRSIASAERRFNHNKVFIQFGKTLLKATEVISFINITKDIKTIVIAISDINSSVNHLVELVKINENGWFPTKEGFKEVVKIVKDSKNIFDSVKDIGKQTGIIIP